MRTLFILRGAPASGKSTWIKESNLEEYTLSSDMVRLLYQGPVTNIDGTISISQNNDKHVWDLLLELLEQRMERGEFVIIDATHYKAPLINRYKDLVDKYRYRVKVVDFSNISEEELLERNSKRSTYKQVPPEVISKMCVALKDDSEVKKAYEIITPEEASLLAHTPIEPLDFNKYQRVVVFGDIHGCYYPLKTYFEQNPFDENYCYIFCGDYIDRGIQNKEVLEFLLTIYDKKNVILLEGNHEKWLRLYSDRHYNLSDYKREYKYTDLCVKKVGAQLKGHIELLEKKIKSYNKEKNDLNKLWEENHDENGCVYYLFEKVNASNRIKELNNQILQCERHIDICKDYMIRLAHDNKHVYDMVELIKNGYDMLTNKELSLNITNLLEKEYPVKALKRENPIKSREFLDNTILQIHDIDKKDLRQLCRKFSQLCYFTFKGTNYLVTHAGVPNLPTLLTPSQDFIKGVGKYEDSNEIEKSFIYDTYQNVVQIHGHRNVFKEDMVRYIETDDGYTKQVVNLNSEVEFGEPLRVLDIGEYLGEMEFENIIYNKPEVPEVIEEDSDIDILKKMIRSPLIQVKELGDNIISLNFTREAFEKGRWNGLTCVARGLFVDKTNGDVIARSFEKFFNHNQVDETKSAALKQVFTYPVVGYKKENGFLGIVSKYQGQIHFFTKSTNQGDYVNWFIGALCNNYKLKTPLTGYTYTELYNKLLVEDMEYLKRLLMKNFLAPVLQEGYSYVFECVDPINDPHIIKYDKDNIVLLEVFKNQLKEEHVPYEELINIANRLDVKVKEKSLEFNTWEEFEEWKSKFSLGITQWDCKHEGYVFEDANGFRVKFKSSFYKFWKQMRGVKDGIQKGSGTRKTYITKEEIAVVKLLQSIPKEELKQMSIIDVEDKFYATYEG